MNVRFADPNSTQASANPAWFACVHRWLQAAAASPSASEVGFLTTPGRDLGEATRLGCNDNPGGPSPTAQGERVEAFLVDGYSPTDVVAARDPGSADGFLRVFASDELSDDEVEEIRAELDA
jgi:Family of unknown function (DUF6281)